MKLSVIDVIFRLIPEACFVNYAITQLSHNKFNKSKYIKSCLIAILCGYIVRSLPITYGIHIILNVICFAAISVIINKYDVVETIKSIIIIFVVAMMIEGLNMVLVTCIFKEKISSILLDTGFKKVILGVPSIIAYVVITVFLYYRGKKRTDIKCD